MPARRNGVIVGLAIAVLCAMLAASAQASTVSAAPEKFGYKAADGEANRVELDFASAVSLRDPGALILPDLFAPLCAPIGLGLHEVVCTAPYGPLLVPFYGCDARCQAIVTLGDRDDTLRVLNPAPQHVAVRLSGGSGNDSLSGSSGSEDLTCGPGEDTVRAGPEDHVAADCEHVVALRGREHRPRAKRSQRLRARPRG